mgnify:FL=1
MNKDLRKVIWVGVLFLASGLSRDALALQLQQPPSGEMRQHWQERVERFQRDLQKKPDDVEVLNGLGIAYSELGQHKEADRKSVV